MKKATFISLLLLITTSIFSQEYIPMKKEANGLYTIPCQVNELKLRFILDTGASSVSLSKTEANFMYKNGYIDDGDIVGTSNSTLADGSIVENTLIHLKTIQIGSVILKDINALVVDNANAPLLLGQSVLGQLGSWSIQKENLVLNDKVTNISGDVSEAIDKAKTEFKANHRENALNLLRPALKLGVKEAYYLFGGNIYEDDNDPDKETCINYLKNLSNEGDKNASDILGNYYRFSEASDYLAIAYFKKTEGTKKYNVNCWTIGRIYQDHGEESNAIIYYKKSAELGWNCGYSSIADLYKENGNYKEAIKWYEKSVASGYKNDYEELADLYLNGKGVTKNIQKGINFLAKSEEPECYADLAEYYWLGIYVNKNIQEARKWNRKLRMNASYSAMSFLLEGLLDYEEKKFYSAVQNLEEGNRRYSEPLKGMRRSNDYITNQAYITLGMCHENGTGYSERDGVIAASYYEKAAENGDASAYGFLGDLFVTNELIQQNYEAAFNYYKLGANNEDPYCCYKVGIFYQNGIYVNQDTNEGQKWIDKAKKLGYDTK